MRVERLTRWTGRSGCIFFEMTGPMQSSVVASSVSLRGARQTEDGVVLSPRQHVARHVKKFRRIESARRRFRVRTWWRSASSGGDGRAAATKVQPSLPPALPSLLFTLPSLLSLLPSPLASSRLIVEERGKGDRGGGRGCEQDKRPAELRVQAHQCARVWLGMFCCGLSRTFSSRSHTTIPWRGSESPAGKKSPKTEQWPAAPVHSAFRVMLCCAAVTRLKEKQKAIRSCQFCLRWANTFFGSHSTSTPS